MNCIFCKIVRGEIPSPRVFENDQCIVIKDIQPQAPHHYLLITKDHVESLDHVLRGGAEAAQTEVGAMLYALTLVAQEKKLKGYRVVTNIGAAGGQSVFHLHFHLLAPGDTGALSGTFG